MRTGSRGAGPVGRAACLPVAVFEIKNSWFFFVLFFSGSGFACYDFLEGGG